MERLVIIGSEFFADADSRLFRRQPLRSSLAARLGQRVSAGAATSMNSVELTLRIAPRSDALAMGAIEGVVQGLDRESLGASTCGQGRRRRAARRRSARLDG